MNTLPTVTITGTVYAELDETKAGLEYAPAGTAIRVSVPYVDYSATNQSNGNWASPEFKLGEDGKFSINVPVVPSGVDATVSFADFVHPVVKLNNVGQTYTVNTHFTCANIAVQGLGVGEADRIVQGTYAAGTVNPTDRDVLVPTTTVTVAGKLDYYSDTSKRVVPEGTTITAVITLKDQSNKQYVEKQTITVGYGGSYSIKVPMVERGTASVDLDAENFWIFTDVYNNNKQAYYRYELNVTIGGIVNFATQPGKNFTYSKGSSPVSDVQ
ncbi:MAG: hypothetical protein LBL13_00690 [Bacteroidales bacterium]|nr:hypothetical protein [Bacteroidales bacterium]